MAKLSSPVVHVAITISDDTKRKKRNALAKEVSRMAQMANKRINRLEKNNLQMTSAYKTWERQGKPHYSVKGKNYQQLQSEYWKIKKVIDNENSLVKTANANLKKMNIELGFAETKNMDTIKQNLNGFWDVFSKIKQYTDTLEGSDYNIGSPRIKEMISDYVKTNKVDLSNMDDVKSAIEKIKSDVDEYASIPYDISSKAWVTVK